MFGNLLYYMRVNAYQKNKKIYETQSSQLGVCPCCVFILDKLQFSFSKTSMRIVCAATRSDFAATLFGSHQTFAPASLK